MPNPNIHHRYNNITRHKISPMNFIRRMLKPVANATNGPTTTKLGRWQLHYDPKVVNSKVDQANEDHCGCCHEPTQHQSLKKEQMLHQKQKWQEKQRRSYTQKHLQKISDSEEYYIPYMM